MVTSYNQSYTIKRELLSSMANKLNIEVTKASDFVKRPYLQMNEIIEKHVNRTMDGERYKTKKRKKIFSVDEECRYLNTYSHAKRYVINNVFRDIGYNIDKNNAYDLNANLGHAITDTIIDITYNTKQFTICISPIEDNVTIAGVKCKLAIKVFHWFKDVMRNQVHNDYTLYFDHNYKFVCIKSNITNVSDYTFISRFLSSELYETDYTHELKVVVTDPRLLVEINYPTVGVIIAILSKLFKQEVVQSNTKNIDKVAATNKVKEHIDSSKKSKYPSLSICIHDYIVNWILTYFNCNIDTLTDGVSNMEKDEFCTSFKQYVKPKIGKTLYRNVLRYLSFYHKFMNSLHFCFSGDVEGYHKKHKVDLDNIDKSIYVDLRKDNVDYFIHFNNCKSTFDDVVYTFNIHTDSPFYRGHLADGLSDYFTPYYRVYYFNNGTFKYAISPCMLDEFKSKYTVYNSNYNCYFVKEEYIDKLCKIKHFEILDILHYAVDMYYSKNVKHIKKKPSEYSTSKSNTCDTNVSYITKPNTCMCYDVVTKTYHKGGKHKSPISHDRIGFYRRVPSHRGDFNFVDGVYVRVYDKTGSHCFVRPTHISGRDGTLVYKV